MIIVLAAFLIQTMFAFAAFAIDLGYIVLTSQQLQNAADAAALASVLELKSADPTLSKEQVRQNAIDHAIRAAGYNKAALRDVLIDSRDIRFGNRHFDSGDEEWVNTYEGDPDFGELPINSVDVRILFDGDANDAFDGSPAPADTEAGARAGRERLSLFFGRVIHVNDTEVSGSSRAHLTPRDLAFILDISGSMSDDTNYTDLAKSMFPFYNGTLPAQKDYSGNSDSLPAPTNTTSPVNYNEFTRTSSGGTYYYTPKVDFYKWLWKRHWADSTWGSATNKVKFADQEFPGMPAAVATDVATHGSKQYWTHWKWRAYVDWTYHSGDFNNTSDRGSSTDVYNGYTLIARTHTNAYNAQNQTRIIFPKNLNVLTAPSGTYANASGSNNNTNARKWGIVRFSTFAVQQGIAGPIAGIPIAPRDGNMDGNLDTFPPAGYNNPLYPYPTFGGYYPKPLDLPGYDHALLGVGESFHGIYPGDTKVKPNCFVRQATLFGINAMISDENAGNDAYDQVGMITYGTLSHRDLELTNDLASALKIANCRVLQAGSNLSITPTGNGNTNIGMAIRQGIQMLKYSARSRSYTSKTMALLTDGVPNIRPTGGNTANEFNGATQTITSSTASGESYTNYWADQAAEEEIVIHTVVVGNGANEPFLEAIAEQTGGVSFVVTDPEANSAELNNIFIAIGKDKLGKLFGEQ